MLRVCLEIEGTHCAIFFYRVCSPSYLGGRGLVWLGRKPPKLPTRDGIIPREFKSRRPHHLQSDLSGGTASVEMASDDRNDPNES